jgi:hypothetical protein
MLTNGYRGSTPPLRSRCRERPKSAHPCHSGVAARPRLPQMIVEYLVHSSFMKGEAITYASKRPKHGPVTRYSAAPMPTFWVTNSMTQPGHTRPPPDAATRRRAPPVLTYSVEQLPSFDAAFYNKARAELSKVAELTVPPREAKAFEVSAGHFFRIVSVEGPQVGDLNLWNVHDLTERFYSDKTRALHATHLSTGDRLWSTFPTLGGTKMALACTMSSAHDATPIPTCC